MTFTGSEKPSLVSLQTQDPGQGHQCLCLKRSSDKETEMKRKEKWSIETPLQTQDKDWVNSQCSGLVDQSIAGPKNPWTRGLEEQGVNGLEDGTGIHGWGGRRERKQLLGPADENKEGLRNTKTNRVREQIQSGGGQTLRVTNTTEQVSHQDKPAPWPNGARSRARSRTNNIDWRKTMSRCWWSWRTTTLSNFSLFLFLISNPLINLWLLALFHLLICWWLILLLQNWTYFIINKEVVVVVVVIVSFSSHYFSTS